MNTVFLLFGSNIEPRLDYLKIAERSVADAIGQIIRLSSIYESEPWGFQAEQSFLNQIVVVETEFSPAEVLEGILSIEIQLGRKREGSTYISRQIDIDILYFDDQIIHEKDLVIPHPGIPDRRFVLLPLVEIAPNLLHPVLKQNSTDLLNVCADESKVWSYKMKVKKE